MKQNKFKLNENDLRKIISETLKENYDKWVKDNNIPKEYAYPDTKWANDLPAPKSNKKRKPIKEAYDDIDFSKTPGIDLSDAYYSPKEIKEKVLALQTAIKDVMDIMNGAYAGKAFSKEMWDRCYDFYNFISEYYIELKQDCRSWEGSWEEDHSDVPYIRKYGDDCTIPSYYGKDGKRLPDDYFKRNFKPHNR